MERADHPGVYGLCNRSGHRWEAVTSKGVARKVAADEVVPVKDGIQLTINGAKVLVKENQ